jgi:hypothetical protein
LAGAFFATGLLATFADGFFAAFFAAMIV